MHLFVRNKRKVLLSVSVALFLFSFVATQFLPERAFAQAASLLGEGGGLTMDAAFTAAPGGIPVNDKPLQLELKSFNVQEKVERSIDKSITAAVLSSAVQGVSYFTRKIAYDTARYVAYGGKGQGALIFPNSWGDYMAQVSGDALGAAVSELSKWAGINLCRFPDLNLQLYLELSLAQKDVPTTDCKWSDLKATYGKDAWVKRYENAKNTADRFSSQDKLLKEFGKTLRPGNTDFGISVGAIMQIDRVIVKREKEAELERTTNKGFKDLQDLISGNIKTPGDVIAEETKTQLSESHQQALSYSQLGSVYASGAMEIIPQTASMFLNTLGATLIQRLFSQGITAQSGDSSLVYDYGSDPGVRNTAESAGNAFNFLFTRTPTQILDYNIVAEFAACPDNPGINNCVMDSGLQEAISQSTVDNPITIREAMEKGGLLNPNWTLISPRRVQDTQNIKGCLSEKYCYSNLQKLRKARILPLGFEIAALRSDPDNPWTLKQVVDGFDDCNRPDPSNPSIIRPDPSKPFCHLIDPNWVIKAPAARCDIKAFGDALIDPASAIRREECVDVSTCLSKDSTGACAQFGYCTKESNAWHIGADSCPAQFNTCTTYNNVDSRKVVSYLAKTVDYGECSIDNVGCRAYSLTGIGDLNATKTSWQNSEDASTNQVIFFNEKIKNFSSICSEKNDGCSAFYGANRLANGQYFDLKPLTSKIEFSINKKKLEYIKKAPNYLGCYDANKALDGIQWPTTVLEAATAQNSAASCDKFASACVAEEVGCEAFRPKNGGPTIPGKIGDNNYCSQVCVGYETFKQEPVAFEKAQFPVYFIPNQAKSCPSVANGCSEFTNIDAQAKGGEGLEYYTNLKYCEKPLADSSNIKTFYSWEGSADNGYVLRTYQMKPLTAAIAGRADFSVGSPAYILDTDEALNEYIGHCDETKYNNLLQGLPNAADLDCRALFDKDGKTYYRLLEKTVTVDEACHPLRKTIPVFVADPSLAGKVACLAKDAHWNESGPGAAFCERCINGGKYQNGFCIYQTISNPKESSSCLPEYNGCRAYSGNAVSNIRDVFSPPIDNFEPGAENADAFVRALEGWSPMNPANPLRIVGESIHTGEHSLQIPGSALRDIASSTVKTGEWYELSFLAKSNEANTALTIHFVIPSGVFIPEPAGVFAPINAPLTIGNTWQQYNIGPVQFTSSTDTKVALLVATIGNKTFFLDQVRLQRISDYKHYIKDSWKNFPGNEGRSVPLACDSAPEDNLPGEALGCREYSDSANTPRYATGFQNLCREKAIGCEPLWDTYNTLGGEEAEQAQLFNIACTGDQNTTCRALHTDKELGSCFIGPGLTSCYIPQIILPAGLSVEDLKQENMNNNFSRLSLDESSIFIPQDTTPTVPLFLAAGESIGGKQKYACNEAELACQKVGQEERRLPNAEDTSFVFNEIFVKNDPANYKDTLCRNSLVGCSHYQSGTKDTFFKDPTITGNSLCSYKSQSNGVSSQYGWYLDKVGKCTTALAPAQVVGNQLCKIDTDCPISNENNVPTQQRCVEIDTVACSPNNLRVGGFYDIASNKSVNYRGNVGICPAKENTCSEIIDRQDTSNLNPEGKPYYVLFNQKIEDKKEQCTQVSLSDGCVLFDKTDEPNKVFDSGATYLKSEKKAGQPYGPVDAVQAGDPAFTRADTNLLMKVNRDRECSEWLACKSYASAVSYIGGVRHETQICAQLAACDNVGVGGTCDHWVDPRSVEANNALTRLTYEQYVTRPVSWYSTELSGYSLYNKYQIGDMIYLKFNFPGDELQRLMNTEMNRTYIVRQLRQNLFDLLEQNALDCKPDAQNQNTDWNICGFGDNQIGGGRCYSNRCVYPIDGSFPRTINVNAPGLTAQQKAPLLKQLISFLDSNSCKGTPELDSPYSDKILKVGIAEEKLTNPNVPGERTNTAFKLEGFSAANVCQKGACSCAYQKIQYGGANPDYWPLFGLEAGTVIPEGICSGGGRRDSRPCTKNLDCVDDKGTVSTQDDDFGQCTGRSNSETRIGLEGYCLEEDRSRPIFYNGQNSFACLTWLPVNISASAVDIYNTDVSAGYNLSDDAGPSSGQVYCASSTATGVGVYDQAYTGALNPAGLTSLYNQFFKEDGLPKFDGVFQAGALEGRTWRNQYENYSCGGPLESIDYDAQRDNPNNNIPPVDANGDGEPDKMVMGLSPYIKAICDDDVEASHTLVRALTAWLYKQEIYNSTVVLRLEYGLLGDSGDETHSWGTWNWGNEYDTDGDQNKDTNRKIYSFAPLNKGADEDDKIREFGTIMHPPRTFSNNAVQETVYAKQLDIINPPESVAVGQNAKVYGNAYGVADEAAARGGRVYRSQFERYMHENDLAVVHFLPLSFPGGADSEVPALMQKDYAIDFDRLRTPGRNPADAVLLLDSNLAAAQFTTAKKNRDTVLWTYRVDDVSQSAFAFNDYSHFNQDAIGAYITGDIGERNRIQTRYVSVFSDWVSVGADDETPNFLQQHVPIDTGEIPGILREQVSAADPSSDPFSSPCVAEMGNWLAIGMDFNKDGEFLGYIARFCQPAGGEDDVGIQFAVAAQLHDRCTTFNQVYKSDGVNPLYGTTNKANTNIVWFGAKVDTGDAPRKLFGNPWSSFVLDSAQRPYGSLRLTEQDLADKKKLRNYVFRDKSQGLPYICSATWFGATNIDMTKRCEAMMLIPQIDRAFVTSMNAGDIATVASEASAKLHGLFAKTWSVNTIFPAAYVVKQGFDEATLDFISPPGIDISGNDARPPKIFALNPARCEDRDKCSAAEEANITIGNRNGTRADYNGDGIPDEPDVDQNNVSDPIIVPGGSYSAEAKFFAFADDSHMPIRRVMVDWDEEGLPPMNADKRGLYKNRKPICGTSNQGGVADVAICATLQAGAGPMDPPTFSSTGLTCSMDKPCPQNSFCIPAVGSLGVSKICTGVNASGDRTYSSKACSEPIDCAGTPETPTCENIDGALASSDLQRGAIDGSHRTMRFGNTPRACTTDYFTFVHQYSCSESNIGTRNEVLVSELDTNANPYWNSSFTEGIEEEIKNKYALRDDDYVCVFRPRVQVEDNWEWCNGWCTTDYTGVNPTAGAATRKGCYNNQPTDNPLIPSRQCDKVDPIDGIYPWSDYDGTIIVVPDIKR